MLRSRVIDTPLAQRTGVYMHSLIDEFNHSPSELWLDVIIVLELDTSAYRHISIGEAGLDFWKQACDSKKDGMRGWVGVWHSILLSPSDAGILKIKRGKRQLWEMRVASMPRSFSSRVLAPTFRQDSRLADNSIFLSFSCYIQVCTYVHMYIFVQICTYSSFVIYFNDLFLIS